MSVESVMKRYRASRVQPWRARERACAPHVQPTDLCRAMIGNRLGMSRVAEKTP